MSAMLYPRLRWVRAAGLVAWTLLLLPPCWFGLIVRGRAPRSLTRLWFRGCCALIGLELEVEGAPPPAGPTLYVANHVSYLDILVLGSLLDAGFIAKAEVRAWPGIGLIAGIGRTLFVERRARASHAQRQAVQARLAAGDSLILFAEGTSSDGSRVLPFKSTLFGAILPVPAAMPAVPLAVRLVPVTIGYERFRGGLPIGHSQRALYGWFGDMTLLPHLWQLLGLPGARVQLKLHPPLPAAATASRKEAARAAERTVAAGLAELRAA